MKKKKTFLQQHKPAFFVNYVYDIYIVYMTKKM